MAEVTVTLRADAALLNAQMAELEALVRASPPWLARLVLLAAEGLEYSVELASFNPELSSASGTHEQWIRPQFTEQMLGLVAALRAGHAELGLLVDGEFDSHGGSLGEVGRCESPQHTEIEPPPLFDVSRVSMSDAPPMPTFDPAAREVVNG